MSCNYSAKREGWQRWASILWKFELLGKCWMIMTFVILYHEYCIGWSNTSWCSGTGHLKYNDSFLLLLLLLFICFGTISEVNCRRERLAVFVCGSGFFTFKWMRELFLLHHDTYASWVGNSSVFIFYLLLFIQ